MTAWAAHITATEAPKTTPGTGWSAGCFSPTGCQFPAACLEHCLDGNADLARSHGCEMIRRMAHPDTSRSDAAEHPGICEKGYAVSLYPSGADEEPTVLILYPIPAAEVPSEAIQPGLDALRRSVLENWRLDRENVGLANEVLQCYEQINLIFDISGEVAALTDPQAVRRVLLEKLRYIYGADGVLYIDERSNSVIQLNADGRVTCDLLSTVCPSLSESRAGNGAAGRCGAARVVLPTEAKSVIRQMRSAPRVLVSSDNVQELDLQGHGTSLWGPLRQGDAQIAIVGVIRRERRFEAGDMLLLDSTLTFGGHILSTMTLVERVKQVSFEAVRALVNAVDQKDPYTSGHSERVGFLSKAVGTTMGLSDEQCQSLEWGGLLHDVGKIGIPEDVLNKPGPLNDQEFDLIKAHPARGHAVLKPVESLNEILEIVLHHHETPDGKGYPDRLAKDEIPLLARIVHVADAFDALTSTRSYREAFESDRAIGILRKDSGPKFDEEIVRHFLKAWENLPNDFPQEYERWFGSREEVTT